MSDKEENPEFKNTNLEDLESKPYERIENPNIGPVAIESPTVQAWPVNQGGIELEPSPYMNGSPIITPEYKGNSHEYIKGSTARFPEALPIALPIRVKKEEIKPIDQPAIRPPVALDPIDQPASIPYTASENKAVRRITPLSQPELENTPLRRIVQPLEVTALPSWTTYKVEGKTELLGSIAKDLGVSFFALKDQNNKGRIDSIAKQGERLIIPVTYETSDDTVHGNLSDLIDNNDVERVINVSEQVSDLIEKNMPDRSFEVHKASEGYIIRDKGASVEQAETGNAIAANELPKSNDNGHVIS